jgi:VRR-NUC domain
MGRLAGVTDLVLLEPRGGYCGMLLEMKREKGGRLSTEQIAFIERHRKRGYFVRVAAGRYEGIAALQEYLALPPAKAGIAYELNDLI